MKNIYTLLVAVALLGACQNKQEGIYTNPKLESSNAMIESQSGNIDDSALEADMESAIFILEECHVIEPPFIKDTGNSVWQGIKFNDNVMITYYQPGGNVSSEVIWEWGCETQYDYDSMTRTITYPDYEGVNAKIMYYDGSKIIIDGKIGFVGTSNKPLRYILSICHELPDGWKPLE